MENLDNSVLFDLKMLRVIAEAKVMTLEKQGGGDSLDRARIVVKILEDDDCFAAMTLDEIVVVLTALGFNPDVVRRQADNLYHQSHNTTKKLSHINK